jgi:hypothetical protein
MEVTEKLQLLTVFNPIENNGLSDITSGKNKLLEHRTKNALQLILQ